MALISVGMPVYNGGEYLEESIRSVLAQTLDDFEFIISDNASTDRTEQICRDYAANDQRICYIRNANNLGAAANFNCLVGKARTAYFRWSNADDVLDPRLQEMCYDQLTAHSDAVLAYGKTTLIDAEGETIQLYEDNLDLRQTRACDRFRAYCEQVGLINAIYGLIRTDALRQTKLLGNGGVPACDMIMLGELAMLGQFIEIPTHLFFRRQHKDASSYGNPSTDTQASFWKTGETSFTFPHWRTHMRYLHTILNAPLSSYEKRKLIRYELWRAFAQKRELFSDITQYPGIPRQS